MPAPLAPSAPASVVRAETEADQGFPYRAVDALRRQGAVSEAEFMTAHPTATCFSTLSDARVCEVQRPAHELCPGDITCTSVGYVFKGTKVVAARFTLPEAEFAEAYHATTALLADPEIRSHSVQGVCTSVQTTTFDLPDARLQFEYTDCGDTARAYGQQQAIIVSLKGSSGA